MKLHVEPLVALCDENLSIRVSQVPPQSKVRLSASLSFPWAKGVTYQSSAVFTADATGSVDLLRQKPDEGSYDFVDSMGLIVSMKSSDPKALEKIARNISIEQDLPINLSAECGAERANATLERLFNSPEIRKQRVSDGFVGEFFFGDDPDRLPVVWIGGSGSGLAINAVVAAPLASRGFNVLSLPFFGEPGLPKQLSRIPLEYFERALDWLMQHPAAAGKGLRVLAMSKGAEVALILASRCPSIRKVALWSPHAYCFQGIAYRDESSWTYQGKDLPYIRLKNRWVFGDMLSGFIRNRPFEFATVYRKGLQLAQNKEAARIKVEDAQADLLMFTSRECGMWNTYDGTVEVMHTLEAHHYPHAFDWIVYENTGEPYLVPYVFPVAEDTLRMAPRLALSLGGTLQGNAYARADAWERAIEFLGKEPAER